MTTGRKCEKRFPTRPARAHIRSWNETRRARAYGAHARGSMQNARACGRVRVTNVAPGLSAKGRTRSGRESYMKITYPVWLALKRPRTNNCSQLKASHTSMPHLRDIVGWCNIAWYFLSISVFVLSLCCTAAIVAKGRLLVVDLHGCT